MRKLAILLGGAIALASCATGPHYTAADVNNPLLAPGFVAQATSANQFEIQSAQLALSASQNPAVQSFANMLIADHTAMGQQMAAAAAAAHLPPPATPALLPPQQAMLDQLRAAGTGYAFDQAFQQDQISAHQQGIALMQNYSASGDVPALRTVAAGAIPVMQRHLATAQSLQLMAPPPPAPPPPPMPAPTTGRAGERG